MLLFAILFYVTLFSDSGFFYFRATLEKCDPLQTCRESDGENKTGDYGIRTSFLIVRA